VKRARVLSPEKIVVEDVPEPKISDNQVLIKVKYCGICGSDIHAFLGKHPFIKPPITPGHEFSGVIVKVGDRVKKVKPGDKVTVIPQLTCGTCYNCKTGRYNICRNLKVIGCQVDGAMAELFAVDENLVFKLPEEISLREAALVEPAAVAIHAVRLSDIKLGDNVVVLGAGPIGLLTLQCAKLAGASKVIVTDIIDLRLKLAEKLGADYAVNVSQVDLKKFIEEKLGPDSIDLVFECVGIEATINQAIDIVRRGGEVVVVGVFSGKTPIKIHLVQDGEIVLKGSLMYLKEDFEKAIDLIASQKLKVTPLITHVVPLSKVDEAYRIAVEKKNEAVKVLVECSKD